MADAATDPRIAPAAKRASSHPVLLRMRGDALLGELEVDETVIGLAAASGAALAALTDGRLIVVTSLRSSGVISLARPLSLAYRRLGCSAPGWT